jgi:hypothetical protein
MSNDQTQFRRPRFLLGRIIMSPAATVAISQRENFQSVQRFLEFHQTGDWGLVRPPVERANEQACENCGDLFSLYGLGDNFLWIVTDDLRRFTVLLVHTNDC